MAEVETEAELIQMTPVVKKPEFVACSKMTHSGSTTNYDHMNPMTLAVD